MTRQSAFEQVQAWRQASPTFWTHRPSGFVLRWDDYEEVFRVSHDRYATVRLGTKDLATAKALVEQACRCAPS